MSAPLTILAGIAGLAACAPLAAIAWVAAHEASARTEARVARRRRPRDQRHTVRRLAWRQVIPFPAASNPHPLKHPAVHVTADSPDAAWRLLTGRRVA